MLSKRKRSDSFSNSETLEEQPTKRQKINKSGTSLQSLPDNCLYKILARLTSLSLCAASLASKRLNDAFEDFISRDLQKRCVADKYQLPQSVKSALYPREQYCTIERLVQLQTKGDIYLEKLLRKLIWILLQKSEKNRPCNDRVAYKELVPCQVFNLWKYQDDAATTGESFRVSFFLLGQAGHIVDITIDVVLYKIVSGYTCELTTTAKLMDGKSSECTKIDELLEGYYEQETPIFPEEKIESEFKKDVKNGDRIKVYWYHKCYPKLNHEKLTQVLEWLDWKMTTIEFAKLLVDQCLRPNIPPSRPAHYKDTNTSNTKASLQVITKLVLEDEDESFDQAVIYLTLLTAKIKLKNWMRYAWRKKDNSKIASVLSLIDRSMFSQWDIKCQGIFREEVYYKFLKGELKLINMDPSKWVRVNFKVSLCRVGCPRNEEDDEIGYSISTSKVEAKDLLHKNWGEPWAVSKDNIKLIKDELRLDDFTDQEIFELLTVALDLGFHMQSRNQL